MKAIQVIQMLESEAKRLVKMGRACLEKDIDPAFFLGYARTIGQSLVTLAEAAGKDQMVDDRDTYIPRTRVVKPKQAPAQPHNTAGKQHQSKAS